MSRRLSVSIVAATILAVSAAQQASAQVISCAFTVNASCSGGAVATLLNGANISGGSLNFDGIDDYVQFSSHIVPTSGARTVAMWVRALMPASGGYQEFISQGASALNGYYIGTNPAGGIRLGDGIVSIDNFPTDQAWHHLAFGTDGTTTTFYIDGSFLNIGVFNSVEGNGGTDTRLGRQFDPYNEFFKGQMNDLGVYNTLLDANQVKALASVRSVPPTTTLAPEPSAFVMLAGGLAAMAAVARRRRQRN